MELTSTLGVVHCKIFNLIPAIDFTNHDLSQSQRMQSTQSPYNHRHHTHTHIQLKEYRSNWFSIYVNLTIAYRIIIEFFFVDRFLNTKNTWKFFLLFLFMVYISNIIFFIIYSGTYTIDIEYKNFLKFFATIDSNIVNGLYDTCGIGGARIMERFDYPCASWNNDTNDNRC